MRLLLLLLLCPMIQAMESSDFNQLQALGAMKQLPTALVQAPLEEIIIDDLSPRNVSTDDELVAKINDIITIVDQVGNLEDAQFAHMITQAYLHGEHIEQQVVPHLHRRLRESNSHICDLAHANHRGKLKKLMKKLVAESVEEAFRVRHEQHEEAERNIKYLKYGLAVAIISGATGVVATFLATFLAH